jgi:alkaline phosphatase
VLGTAQVNTTLRQARDGKNTADPALDTPVNPDLPDLPLLARAAVNTLSQNPKGFFLLIEGGAVDWANHSHQPGRMIQEHIDYINAVEAVVQWIESKSSWKDTLLVLTADHETGLLWGPKSDVEPFDPIVDHGKGAMPGLLHNAKGHSNSLVPVYAKGAGSERLAGKVAGKDPVRGPYVDNTGVSEVLAEAVGGAKP